MKSETRRICSSVITPLLGGMPTWATLIGLSFEGRPVVGLMNQPVVGDMFYGNPLGAWHSYRGTTSAICGIIRSSTILMFSYGAGVAF